MIIKLCILAVSMAIGLQADCTRTLEKNVGWTIIDSKTIKGFRDKSKKSDSFEGCDYDRVIYFTDGTTVTCTSYGYQYAYMPTAIILGKALNYQGKNMTMYKMIVENDEYDIR